jgi:hypothetical protein
MLTAEVKTERARQRMLEGARKYQLGTYSARFVAPVFQQMIRAEAAAQPSGLCVVIVDGELSQALREVGFCACVTCGTIAPWKGNTFGGGEIETGHFIASRRNSILFEETNVAPQCKLCNRHRGGEQQLYRKWMLAVRGPEAVERLERLKTEVVSYTREQLVDMRIGYAARLKAAEERMFT